MLNFSDYDDDEQEEVESYEEREKSIKIAKGQARFLHEITGRSFEDLVMMVLERDRKSKDILFQVINEIIPDLNDKNVALILEDMYSLSGKKPPLSVLEIKKKYLGKIHSIERGENGETYPLDFKTVIHISLSGINSIKERLKEQRKEPEKKPEKQTRDPKKNETPRESKPKTERISQVSVEDQIENIRQSKKLLNSLGVIDNEKIRLFAKSISPKEFSVFFDMHPLYESSVLSMPELQTKHNLSFETIWKISNKVLKKLSTIVGVTIPQVRLSKQTQKDKNSPLLSYNIYVEKILAKHNIIDINIIYALSNRIDKKKLAIYLQLVPLGFEKPLTVEEILSLNRIDIIELKKIIAEIKLIFFEIAKIEIKCPEIVAKEVIIEEKKEELQESKSNNYKIIENVLLIHGIVNPELVDKILKRLSDRECLILSLLYEKNMSIYEITFELKISYYGVTAALEKIRNKLSDEFGLTLNKIKRSKMVEKHDYSKSKEKKANEIRDLARKTLEYYGIIDEEKLEIFIRQISINDLLKFLKSKEILGYKREDESKASLNATSRIMKSLKEIFGISFHQSRDLFSKNQKQAKIEKVKDRVILLLNYYGITDEEKINAVCEKINEADLNIYLISIGFNLPISGNDIDERTKTNSISAVKSILKKICGLSFKRNYEKFRETKKAKIGSNVEKLLNYYGITDEEKINAVCNEITEFDLEIFLEKIGLIPSASEDQINKRKSAISTACCRVRSILKKICGLEFEESRKKVDISDESIEEFTKFFYKNGITDSQTIKSIINVIGDKALKTFILYVENESFPEKTTNEKQMANYYIRKVQGIIKEKTGITILTLRQKNIEQEKAEKDNNIIHFQLDENQMERLNCLIRESSDIKKITALSLILSLANRSDVSYDDLANALNISKSLAKKRFLLALQEVKDAIGIEYDGDEYPGGRHKKPIKQEQ